MTMRLRAARPSDLEHLYEMAKLTAGCSCTLMNALVVWACS